MKKRDTKGDADQIFDPVDDSFLVNYQKQSFDVAQKLFPAVNDKKG